MTKAEAQQRAAELAEQDPDSRYIARGGDDGWEVVRVPGLAGRTKPMGTSTEARPRPEADDPREHRMHPESYEISPRLAGLVEVVREQGGRVWAVGTTVVRALESAAQPDGTIRSGSGQTSLMITPGYPFRVVDRLLTNFHLPRSTLLMLVSAFAGHELAMAAYAHAVSERYRFYSYGDAMVIL